MKGVPGEPLEPQLLGWGGRFLNTPGGGRTREPPARDMVHTHRVLGLRGSPSPPTFTSVTRWASRFGTGLEGSEPLDQVSERSFLALET